MVKKVERKKPVKKVKTVKKSKQVKKKTTKLLKNVALPLKPLPQLVTGPQIETNPQGVLNWTDTSFRELYEWCCSDPQKPEFFDGLMNNPAQFLSDRLLRLPEACLNSLIWLSQRPCDVEYSKWCVIHNVPWLYWISDTFRAWCQANGYRWLQMEELPPKVLYNIYKMNISNSEAPPCPWDDCPPASSIIP